MALTQIEKQFGKGSVMKLGDAARFPFRSSPQDALNLISHWAWAACRADASSRSTGRNHRARPRWRCTWWPRHKKGGAAAFVDAEHARLTGLCQQTGVDTDNLYVSP